MPVANPAEAAELDHAIDGLFAATPTQCAAALQRLFVERLDFEPAYGEIALHQEGLPPTAQRIAEREGVDVVLVQLPTTGRLTAKPLADALKESKRTLSEVFLVATNAGGAEWQFVYPTHRAGREVLRRMAVHRGQPRRTVTEGLAGVYDEVGRIGLRAALENAYDVEAVTKRFFSKYSETFYQVLAMVTGLPDDEERRLFCQTLFNRLMFLYFLQRKGWLTFDGNADYLNALWRSHTAESAGDQAGTFYTTRLKLLFFTALNNPRSGDFSEARDAAESLIGRVPFLNGGLFAEEELDRRAGVDVPDEAIRLILRELFARFNFTITESTPYDVEVAVDPEMLGKVFEELVTGRHETGSYYTPRPVVAFMCREALKGYLSARVEGLAAQTAAAFVDEHRVDGLALSQARAVLDALEEITVVDPACGSGAYLLGMLHELVDLQRLLYSSDLIADSRALYDLKLHVIERNVYGVDVDRFAVNIAMLRLWLSLVVDYEGQGDPPALPNLDYKIARGDSLTAPAPEALPDLIGHAAGQMARAIARLKGEYMRAKGEEKRPLHDEIEERQVELRAMLAHSAVPAGAVDWRVQFAEVFECGGFDVVLANPPYVRQELIKDLKPALKSVYGNLYSGTADLYVFFYYRALQLLKQHGMLVFISSNKWFRANYGAKLREHIADTCHVVSITDFGELPVFEAAATFPMIIAAQHAATNGLTRFTQVKSLQPPYPDVRTLIMEQGQILPNDAIKGQSWTLTDAVSASRLQEMRNSGIHLDEFVGGRIYYGAKTGFNAAFVIDGKKREELIAQDARSAQIIKRLVVGDNIRRWRIDHQDKWIIFARHGIDIDSYPVIRSHLSQWKTELTPKPRDWPSNREWLGRKPGSYRWYEIQDEVAYYPTFEQPKIVFPDIAKEPRFALDATGAYINNTTYFIAVDDLYLLGVLNCRCLWNYSKERLTVLGDADKGGRLRFFRQFVQDLPIPAAPTADRNAIADLVQKCLDVQGQGPEVATWEAEIDARVARLYGLTEAEVARVI